MIKKIKSILYILFSQKNKKTHTGSTNNLTRRLNKHNKGFVKSTQNRRPLKLIYQEKLNTLKDARKRERYFKSCAGRKKIKEILKNTL